MLKGRKAISMYASWVAGFKIDVCIYDKLYMLEECNATVLHLYDVAFFKDKFRDVKEIMRWWQIEKKYKNKAKELIGTIIKYNSGNYPMIIVDSNIVDKAIIWHEVGHICGNYNQSFDNDPVDREFQAQWWAIRQAKKRGCKKIEMDLYTDTMEWMQYGNDKYRLAGIKVTKKLNGEKD